ncbi:MAB_1171c family putative transporter [Tsukamurella sp. 1534]|uniref:MAB_1171c family putative transporter n=1 Tax=Tsukamurella sp. 1534 TaxID=1151061 RepID=UPI0002F4A4BB|nr:MAB_1171c family putative transporter [Tsukamurella sp. 1534]
MTPPIVLALNDALFSTAAVTCAIAAALIAVTCFAPGRTARVRRWVALSFALKAIAFAAAAPWIVRRVNAAFADSVSLLVAYSTSPLWCASMIVVARTWRGGAITPAYGAALAAAALGSVTAMAVLWSSTSGTELTGAISAELAEHPAGTALVLTYAGSLAVGLVALYDACRFHIDRDARGPDPTIRRATTVISCGVALYLCFAGVQGAKAMSSAGGTPLIVLEYLTAPVAIAGAVLLAAGFAYPEARHRWDGATRATTARRSCRTLTPLWADLNAARGAAAPPWLAGADPEIRLYRMMVDIHDGLLHLAPHLPGADGRDEQSSADFAREIHGALRRHESAASPEGECGFGGISRRPDLPFDQQISWLRAVARDYRALTVRE